MTGPLLPPSRRFSEKEVAQIIRRASELQEDEAPADSASGMSLAELEQIAREAGLDPALVRRAASDLDSRVSDQAGGLAGAPTRLRLERTVEGELPPEEFEAVVLEIQSMLGEVGTASTLGRSLHWTASRSGRHRHDFRTVQVTISPRNGRTTIRIDEQLHGLAGGVFGGIVGGMGGGLTGAAVGVGMGVLQSGPATVGMVGAALGGAYLLARAVYARFVERRGRRLQELAAGLVERVAANAVRLPPPANPAGRGAPGQGG